MLAALRRVLAYFRRNRLDDDLAEEIRLHLELRKQALIDSGVAPADADREARRQFGNVTAIRERTRDQWGGSSIDTLIQDVRYGFRMIRKAPGFSAVAIASLAVGIGASTVLFSFANSVLFRPLHAVESGTADPGFHERFRGWALRRIVVPRLRSLSGGPGVHRSARVETRRGDTEPAGAAGRYRRAARLRQLLRRPGAAAVTRTILPGRGKARRQGRTRSSCSATTAGAADLAPIPQSSAASSS